MKKLVNLKLFIPLFITATVLLSPSVLAVTIGPSINIDTINGYTPPFNFVCPTNPLLSPVNVTGSGTGSAPPGLIEQYKVQVDWGDSSLPTNDLGIFTPPSGQGGFSFAFTAGPHSYSSGDYTIKARLYHQEPPGNDNQADSVVSIPICVVTEPPILVVIKEVINDDEGDLSPSDFSLHVKIDGQDVFNSPAPGSENGTDYTLAPGTFVISEDPVSGYDPTISGDCAPDGSITLASGDYKTCTITNDDIVTECIPEGESGAVVPGELECCEGLIQIGCDQPDQSGNCIDECVGAFYCTNCGDGICGLGENKCNCPEDCEEEPESITIYGYKVVCQAEEYLPNWATSGTQAGEPSTITETTAQDFVTESQGKCWLEEGWDFQWGWDGQAQIQAGNHIGPAPGGTGWNDFDSSTGVGTPAQVQISELDTVSTIWMRENLKANYIPFANPPGDLQNNISAEILCHNDILNYDNYDYINNVQLGETYYCVAFNAPTEEPQCTDNDQDGYSVEGGDCGQVDCDDGNTAVNPGAEEICTDEVDNDCDDDIDCDDGNCVEDPACIQVGCQPEEQRACQTGEPGICAAGTQTCTELAVWGECVQNTQPSAEICGNGIDEDCSGADATCPIIGPPITIGGGSVGGSQLVIISNEENGNIITSSAIVIWDTNIPATSRVVYDTVSHPVLGAAPNYGYAYSTPEDSTKVTYHVVIIPGLVPGTSYFWRAISHNSPEVLGDELSLITTSQPVQIIPPAETPAGPTAPGPGEGEVAGETEEAEVPSEEGAAEEVEGFTEGMEEIGEEMAEEETETGLNRFLAAVGNIFGIGSLCWVLILFLIVLLVAFYLMKKGIKKQDEGAWWIIGIVTVIAVLIALAQKLCWVLIFPIILLIILMILDYMKKDKEKKSKPTF